MDVHKVSIHGEFEGVDVTLNVIEPGPPEGFWPGCATRIREWLLPGKGMGPCVTPDDATVRRLEAGLGQLTAAEIARLEFVTHPTLGRVAVLPGDQAPVVRLQPR